MPPRGAWTYEKTLKKVTFILQIQIFMATYLNCLNYTFTCFQERREFQVDLPFLFKVSSSGKLVVENYLQFQAMSYNDKKGEANWSKMQAKQGG